MEGFGGCGLDNVGNAVRKKRSNTSRRPRPDSQSFLDGRDFSPPSSTPASENVSRGSSDENTGLDTGFRRDFNLNQATARAPSVNGSQSEASHKKFRKDDGTSGSFIGFRSSGVPRGSGEQGRSGSDFKRSSEGALAPANWRSMSKLNESSDSQLKKPDRHLGHRKNDEMQKSGLVSDGSGNENKLKVKLKVGGVTRTIHTKASSDGSSLGVPSSTKSSRFSDISRPRPKLILQENSDDDQSPPPSKTSVQDGVALKYSSRGNPTSLGKKDEFYRSKMPEGSGSGKQTDKSEAVRKSKRVPKRRFLDGEFSDGDGDEEIRYLEKLKSSKVSVNQGTEYEDDGSGGKKHRKVSRISKIGVGDGEYFEDVEYGSSRLGRDNKKRSKSEKVNEDTDYVEYEELGSDAELDIKRKKQKKESVDLLMEGKKESTLTTRQRALQGKDASTGPGSSLIEFPDGLPPAPSRKQKDKLTDVEQQLKKAEAAQRRRMQVEKAARESQAEAIRKILGQDSSRKKKEDKIKKRNDERAQERAANAKTLPPSTIRWVIGPTGTVVIFPEDVSLPSIFSSTPCSYPPPREKCAGPSCTNAYKYRDSKSKLPLCSLQCYKAVKDQGQPVSTC